MEFLFQATERVAQQTQLKYSEALLLVSHGYLRFLRKVTSVIALLQNISDYLVQHNSLTFCNFPLGQRKPRIGGDQMNKNDITRSGREKVRTCAMLSSCWIYNQPPILYYSRKNWTDI